MSSRLCTSLGRKDRFSPLSAYLRVWRIGLLAMLIAAVVPLLHAQVGQAQTAAPSVTAVALASDAGMDATYALGDTIRISLTFSEAVDVTGAPQLAIDMDPADWGTKWAGYESGSGTTSLVFAHTVIEPNYSSRGVALLANTLKLNGGSIKSASSQADAALTHAGLDHHSHHRVNWRLSQSAPTITLLAVTSNAGGDNTYALGETIQIMVAFSEAVAVSGTPNLKIDMDPAFWGEKTVSYDSGGGTTRLVFTHTVVEPNISTRGIAVLADSLALNGGSIQSASSQLTASLGHPGLDHDPAHQVNWRLSAPAEPACPLDAPSSVSALTIERGAVVSWSVPDDLADECEVTGFVVSATNADDHSFFKYTVSDPDARSRTIRDLEPGDYFFSVRIEYGDGTSDDLVTANANSVVGACITFAVKPYSRSAISGKITSVNGTGCLARTELEIQTKRSSDDYWRTYGRFTYKLQSDASLPDFIFGNRDPYVAYDFRIRAYDASDSQYISTTASATIVANDPAETADANSPRNVRVLARNDSDLYVTWQAPASLGTGRTLQSYEVEWKKLDDTTAMTADVSDTDHQIGSLTDGERYVVRVGARTVDGGSNTAKAWSVWTPAVEVWSEPTQLWFSGGTPLFNHATGRVFMLTSSNKVGTSTCTLDDGGEDDDINCPSGTLGNTGTLVSLEGSGSITVDGTVTTDTSRTKGSTTPSVGLAKSAAAPLARASGGNGSLYIVWKAVTINPSSGHGIGAIDAYIVQHRSGTTGAWTEVTKTATDRKHEVTGLADGTYQIRVRARDNGDDGDPMTTDTAIPGFTSEILEVTLATSGTITGKRAVIQRDGTRTVEDFSRSDGKGDVGRPHDVRITLGDSQSLIVEWEPPLIGAAAFGYQVRHKQSGAASWTESDVIYPRQTRLLCGVSTCQNPRSHKITGLTGGTLYEVQVRVNNKDANGAGDWSYSRIVRPND